MEAKTHAILIIGESRSFTFLPVSSFAELLAKNTRLARHLGDPTRRGTFGRWDQPDSRYTTNTFGL